MYCISRISEEQETSSYDEVAHDPCGQQAMVAKLNTLMENHTWDVISLSLYRKPIDFKWV